MNTLHLTETEPHSDKEHPRLPVNIPPGESRAFNSSMTIYYEAPIAEQLRSIFENTSEFAKSKLHHPSLARLNLFAVASADLKAQGGSPYPYLSPDFIKNYTLVVGMEDFTNNHRSETVKIFFSSQEFMSFVNAPPGETRTSMLSSDQRKHLKLPPESPESTRSVVIRRAELLNQLAETIALIETKGECCRH